MPVHVTIPRFLQQAAGGQASIDIDGNTIAEVVDHLLTDYPALAHTLCDGGGALRESAVIYLDDEDYRGAQGMRTPVHDGSTLTIYPMIAGG